ncbi:hypothetical protein BSKO_12375 [Bryopsis sp. KO-2023]|nr:hypothetical protein BSKO_12375 [Bryopsis sp. KO-2023]
MPRHWEGSVSDLNRVKGRRLGKSRCSHDSPVRVTRKPTKIDGKKKARREVLRISVGLNLDFMVGVEFHWDVEMLMDWERSPKEEVKYTAMSRLGEQMAKLSLNDSLGITGHLQLQPPPVLHLPSTLTTNPTPPHLSLQPPSILPPAPQPGPPAPATPAPTPAPRTSSPAAIPIISPVTSPAPSPNAATKSSQ